MGTHTQEPAAAPGDIDPAKTALAPNYQRPVAGPGPPVLLHTNFRLLCYLKKDVDSRVIVVGSSETAMGLVDMLMSVPYLSLHRVTLVCAGGLPTAAPRYRHDRLSFSAPEILRHYSQGRCEIISGSLESLDRQKQSILVRQDGHENEGGQAGVAELVALSYDYLVLATGLIDTTVHNFKVPLKTPLQGIFGPYDKLAEDALDMWAQQVTRPRYVRPPACLAQKYKY